MLYRRKKSAIMKVTILLKDWSWYKKGPASAERGLSCARLAGEGSSEKPQIR